MNDGAVVGIDVGGTKLAGVVVAGGSILRQLRRPLTGRPLADQVIGLARELATGGDNRPTAVGVAVPGQVSAGGVIDLAVNLGARDLPMGALVSHALGLPCDVEHDARAVAAWLAAAEGDHADLAYVSVGTGISVGVVVDGRLLRGSNGLAGEIGHQLADPAGDRCACGLPGCLEVLASGPAIARQMARASGDARPPGTTADLSTADVYAAAAAGDPVAREVIERAATHLAAAVRGVALAYGSRRVAIGGGVTRAGAAFRTPLLAALARERAASALVARALPLAAVEVIDDDRPIGALAAAAVAHRHVASLEREVRTR